MEGGTTYQYELGTRSGDEITEEIANFWDEFDRSDDLRRKVQEAGVNPTDLEQLDRQETFDIREKGAGIDPGTVSLIVAFAPIGSHIAISLWDKFLLPRIRGRWGKDAVGEKINKG